MNDSISTDTPKINERWYWHFLKASIITTLVFFGSIIAPKLFPYGSSLNDYFRLTRANHIAIVPKHKLDITLIMIDENFISQLPYRSPIDRCVLAAGISSIMTLDPKVVGVDFLLDGKTEQYKDQLLKNIIKIHKDKLVVAINSTENLDINRPSAETFEDYFLPNNVRASALIIKDTDFVVRNALLEDSGVPTFAVKLVEKYNSELINESVNKQFQIDWLSNDSGKRDAFSIIPFELLLDLSVKRKCNVHDLKLTAINNNLSNPIKESIRPLIENKIVILGVDLEREDRHLTPFDIIWRDEIFLSGAELHSNIVQQLIDGRTITNVHWGVSFILLCLLFFLSSLFLVALERRDKLKLKFFLPIGSTILLTTFSWASIYYFGYVLPTGLVESAIFGFVALNFLSEKLLGLFKKFDSYS